MLDFNVGLLLQKMVHDGNIPQAALTACSSPSKTASTLPSGKFRTHPVTPNLSACCLVFCLKKTLELCR